MKLVEIMSGKGAHAAITALLIMITTSSVSMTNAFAQDSAATYEAWKFQPGGDILAMSLAGDISGDEINDIVAADDHKSVYMIDGLTGSKIWNYTTADSNHWVSIVTSLGANFDVDGDSESEVFVAAKDGFVLLLDGASGRQIWNVSKNDGPELSPTDPCFPPVRSAHMVSDIDGDNVRDVVVVSGSGDQCAKNDIIEVLALSTKSGGKIWEFVHEQDFHGLKDGNRGSSPAGVVDINKDGIDDVVVADNLRILYVVNGKNANVIETDELVIAGAIWNFIVVPDLSGDGVQEAIAFEFIDGQGGPDYASIDVINLASNQVIWQAKLGDGLYEGGAAYSAAFLTNGDESEISGIAITQRIDNDLHLAVLDANTGQKMWQFSLGEDRSRNDLDKHYPVARIADLNGNGHDEIVVGSIDSKVYFLDGSDGSVIWRYSNVMAITQVAYIQTEGDAQLFVLFTDDNEVHALAGLTPRTTELTIRASHQTIPVSSKLIISGSLSPPFRGEVVTLRYVDPSGSVTEKPLLVEKDGAYTDIVKPELLGTWKVSSSFTGEGYYLSSQSPTISFDVINETKNSVYMLTVATPTAGGSSSEVTYPIVYLIDGGEVTAMSLDKENKSLNIGIDTESESGTRMLKIELSRSVIDAVLSDYQVYLDGRAASFEEIEDDSDSGIRTLSIPFSAETKRIQIIGTYVVPEFTTLYVFAAALISVTAAITFFHRRSNRQRFL